MAKRLTKDQKTAMQNYWRTIAGQDNYKGSVFVSAAQDVYYAKLIAEKASKCKDLGITVNGEPIQLCQYCLSSVSVELTDGGNYLCKTCGMGDCYQYEGD